MMKRVLVTGNWFDKTTGKPVSGVAEIRGGISKASGKAYEMAQTDNRETVDGTYPVGTVLTLNMTVQAVPPASSPFGETPPVPAVKPSK